MKNLLKGVIISTLFAGLLFAGCDDGNDDGGETIDPVPAQGKLLILQAYGNGHIDGSGDNSGSPNGVSHSFVELYNISDEPIDLDGIGLYYANGIKDYDVTEDEPWKRIALNGTIPAKGSFLILGAEHTDLSNTRYKIDKDYGDINTNDLILFRRGFKVALIESTDELTVQNPFNNGNPVQGYIDMVGAVNNPDSTPPDHIFGYETAPARNSASEAVRRADLFDYDNNSTDFVAARYAIDGMTNEELEVRSPRNSKVGSWDPFEKPAEPVPIEKPAEPVPTEGLMIFQVHGTGFADPDNGDNKNTGAISHSFVELYNNSDVAIPLDTFSVQWANGIANGGGTVLTGIGDWNVIPLSGTIPAYGSYLVRGTKVNDENDNVGRLQITVYDKDVPDFEMSNRSFKVALVSSQIKLDLSNPWDTDTSSSLVPELLDLFGTRNGNNDSIDAFIGAVKTGYSKQQSMRRNSLSASTNNNTDFTGINYNNGTGSTAEGLAKFRPRTTSDSSWTPEF